MKRRNSSALTRRSFIAGLSAIGAGIGSSIVVKAAPVRPPVDATFVFTCDIHACLVSADALSPNCAAEGKTDANLLRHVAAINNIASYDWPEAIDGKPSGLAGAGKRIAEPLGIVIGGDMTDDGGGQVKVPGEGHQLLQFSNRYRQGSGPGSVHFPVYNGLGNHDLDQDGAPPHEDWYRRELRDYVELNHRQTVFYKPPVPVGNYDVASDSYSWDWGGLHLVHLQRFGGDVSKGAFSGLRWLRDDLAQSAADGRPVVLFQHYGWDAFSTERWDPAARTFDDQGAGAPHWWSQQQRDALLGELAGYNIAGFFHGHEHPSALIYNRSGIDIFKPVASFLGGFALVHITDAALDIVMARATADSGRLTFTHAFTKRF